MAAKRFLLFLTLFLFCGCGMNVSVYPAERRAVPFNMQRSQEDSSALIFLVDTEEDPVFAQAAQLFAQKLQEQTNGDLQVMVQISSDPLVDYQQGEGDFIFFDARDDAAFSESLHFLSSPMLYQGYLPFTMSLHSDAMQDLLQTILQEEQQTVPLTAFYQGSPYMLALRDVTRSATNSMRYVPNEDTLPQQSVAAVAEDSVMQGILTRYGMQVAEQYSLKDRLYGLRTGSMTLAEITLAELQDMQISTADLTLMRLGHGIAPKWLLMRAETKAELSEQSLAALEEAVAVMVPAIDHTFLAQDDHLEARFRQAGGTVESWFPALSQTADTVLQEQAEGNREQQYMLRIIRSLE